VCACGAFRSLAGTTLRSWASWAAVTALLALAVSFAFPPAFWLCAIGAAVFVIALVAQSNRIGQDAWWPWQENDTSLTSKEAKWALVGAALVAVPLLVALSRCNALGSRMQSNNAFEPSGEPQLRRAADAPGECAPAARSDCPRAAAQRGR
jgi:hypothetical protein